MKVAAACPGDFHMGFDSLVRGEGRWWLLVLRALHRIAGHDVYIIGQHNHQYFDEESGIQFLNLKDPNVFGEFDIVFSMDAWANTGVDENWITPHLNVIKTKQKVYAPFFNNDQANKQCTIPVVYPYYYDRGTCIPICPGTMSDLKSEKNNFGFKNVVWFSKNSHENPEYLLASFTNAVNYVMDKEGALVVVDGHVLVDKDYPNKMQIIYLLNQANTPQKRNVILLNEWLKYSQMRKILKSSAFITGIHHPVANPMSLDIVFDGGIVVQFENQRFCAPYNNLIEPFDYISFKKTSIEDISKIYKKMFYNEENYMSHRNRLIDMANLYTEEAMAIQFELFIKNL